jgi:hypothetical protein
MSLIRSAGPPQVLIDPEPHIPGGQPTRVRACERDSRSGHHAARYSKIAPLQCREELALGTLAAHRHDRSWLAAFGGDLLDQHVAEAGGGDQLSLRVGQDARSDRPAEEEVGVAVRPVRGAGTDRLWAATSARGGELR